MLQVKLEKTFGFIKKMIPIKKVERIIQILNSEKSLREISLVFPRKKIKLLSQKAGCIKKIRIRLKRIIS